MKNDWIFFLLSGLAGGVLAGMGMGGGTLTIPLLTFAMGVEQLTAQYVNLLAFVPTGTASLGLHLKNKLVSFKNVGYLLLPAVIASAISSVFAFDAGNEILTTLFGCFLVAVAVFSLGAECLKKS